MNDSEKSESGPTLFSLPKTRISITQNEMCRSNKDGSMLLRIPLNSIQSVEFRRPFAPSSITFLLVAAGLVAIGIYISAYNWLSVLLYVLAFLVGGIGILGMQRDTLFVQRAEGNLSFDCDEPSDEVRQFVMSFESILGQSRSRR